MKQSSSGTRDHLIIWQPSAFFLDLCPYLAKEMLEKEAHVLRPLLMENPICTLNKPGRGIDDSLRIVRIRPPLYRLNKEPDVLALGASFGISSDRSA